MKNLACGVVLLVGSMCATVASACAGEVLDGSAKRLLGETVSLCDAYAGKVVLVVNTASKCGYVGQLGGLQSLQERYEQEGFTVLGFPSADFGGQEFDSAEKTAEFCRVNYGVAFPMFETAPVKAEQAQPMFQRLFSAGAPEPGWNYHKYLLNREGAFVAAFDTRVAPDDARLRKAVEQALAR